MGGATSCCLSSNLRILYDIFQSNIVTRSTTSNHTVLRPYTHIHLDIYIYRHINRCDRFVRGIGTVFCLGLVYLLS